jgi:hypothetical protein
VGGRRRSHQPIPSPNWQPAPASRFPAAVAANPTTLPTNARERIAAGRPGLARRHRRSQSSPGLQPPKPCLVYAKPNSIHLLRTESEPVGSPPTIRFFFPPPSPLSKRIRPCQPLTVLVLPSLALSLSCPDTLLPGPGNTPQGGPVLDISVSRFLHLPDSWFSRRVEEGVEFLLLIVAS